MPILAGMYKLQDLKLLQVHVHEFIGLIQYQMSI